MSIIGDVVGDLLGNLMPSFGGRGSRSLRKLLNDGETLEGVIDGFRITSNGETDDDWVSVRVAGPHGEFRATVKQRLGPHGEHARLGAPVLVRHRRGRIVVDWPATLRRLGYEVDEWASIHAGRTLREPRPPGIEDYRVDKKKLARGTPADAQLVGVEAVTVFGMSSMNRHLHLVVDGRPVVVKRAFVADYAAELLHDGAVLPVAVDPKDPQKVTIDWETAAERAAATA